jgi:hypothetical protein
MAEVVRGAVVETPNAHQTAHPGLSGDRDRPSACAGRVAEPVRLVTFAPDSSSGSGRGVVGG